MSTSSYQKIEWRSPEEKRTIMEQKERNWRYCVTITGGLAVNIMFFVRLKESRYEIMGRTKGPAE